MTPEKMEELRRRMNEVALLSHEHPDRQALLREISGIDGPLEREWLDLLREDERLRLELARVDPPPGLEERLLAIAREHPPRRRRWLLRWLAPLAAVVVVGLGVWVAITAVRQQRQEAALREFAVLAVAGDERRPELTVTTPDWQVVRASLQDQFPRSLDRPTELDPSLSLVGGRAIMLAGNRVLYTRWQAPDGRNCSLYVFCATDFGLRRPLERRTITPRVSPGGRVQVLLWTEGHCDYALVLEQVDATEAVPSPA